MRVKISPTPNNPIPETETSPFGGSSSKSSGMAWHSTVKLYYILLQNGTEVFDKHGGMGFRLFDLEACYFNHWFLSETN